MFGKSFYNNKRPGLDREHLRPISRTIFESPRYNRFASLPAAHRVYRPTTRRDVVYFDRLCDTPSATTAKTDRKGDIWSTSGQPIHTKDSTPSAITGRQQPI